MVSRTKQVVAAVLVLVAVMGLAGCGDRSDEPASDPPGRGALLSVRPVASLDRAAVAVALDRAGYDATQARDAVRGYRVRYTTVDPHGGPTTASGLVALPAHGRLLRAVVYAHGTTSVRTDVASRWRDPSLYAPALAYAGAGFAAVLPDYLGLGDGPGRHPWFDVPSETTASADLLQAADRLVVRQHRALRTDVDVTGFSQGASAALGLGRALQEHRVGRFGLHSLAPVSGAYAFRRAELPALLGGRLEPHAAVAYTTYLLVAWNRLHHLYDDPGEVFRAPYAARADRLFDGTTPGRTMLAGLPGGVDALLTPHGRRLLTHPTGRFAAALRVADAVCAWRPRAPVRLYAAEDDEQAVPANTTACRTALRRHGAEPTVVSLGRPDADGSRHLGSNVAGVVAVTRWLAALQP